SPDGTLLAAADAYVVTIWRLPSRQLLREFRWEDGDGYPITSLAFSPDNKVLLALAADHRARRPCRVFDVATAQALSPLGHALLYGASFSPDGKMLAAHKCTEGQGDLGLWDFATGKLVKKLSGKGNTFVVRTQFTTDGRQLFVWDWNGDLA